MSVRFPTPEIAEGKFKNLKFTADLEISKILFEIVADRQFIIFESIEFHWQSILFLVWFIISKQHLPSHVSYIHFSQMKQKKEGASTGRFILKATLMSIS